LLLRRKRKRKILKKKFACEFPGCEKNFTQDRNRAAHVRTTHSSNTKRYVCGVCGTSYVHKRNLVNHEKLHSEKDILKCDICGRICQTTNGLGVHKIFTHHPFLLKNEKKGRKEKVAL